MEEDPRPRNGAELEGDGQQQVEVENQNSNFSNIERLNTSYHDNSVLANNQFGDLPCENGSMDYQDGSQLKTQFALPPFPLLHSNKFSLPRQENSQEVISISDDEDDQPAPDVHQYLRSGAPGPAPRPPIQMPPMSFPAMMMGPPPPRPLLPHPHSLGGPDNVITLSDDDEDDVNNGPKTSGKKRKRSSRRGIMYNPQICVFCYKPKRENICMAKHLISRHWARIRSHNMGNSKTTDYSNLKDDREIPTDRGFDRRERESRYERLAPPPLPPLPPPPPLSVGPGSSQSFARPHLIEQPLRPSMGGFSRPPPAVKEERKSLGQEVAEELGHPSNRKLVQHQLSMLMHAHKCDGRARKANSLVAEEKSCTVPNCDNTKQLLTHLPGCQAETDCLIPKCFMSKQIIKWALSADSPEVLRETRSELSRQIRAGLPPEVVKWATKHPFEKEQWKSWRDTKNNSQANTQPSPAANQTQTNSEPATAVPATDNSVPEWKRKYQAAAQKKRELAAQKMKNGSNSVREEDRIMPSQAPADILSSLLSAQTASADLRRVKRGQTEDKKTESMTPVPKLIAPPAETASSGEEAAQYNSMLV